MAGDFDGDGVQDLALRVQRGDGVHIVAAFVHTYVYVLQDVVGNAASSMLSVRPRGALYRVPDSVVDHYLGADTLVLTPCGQPPVAYIWTGASFTPQPIVP